MDKRKNNKGTNGNKGGRRPSLTNEKIRAAVIDKSWTILLDFLNAEIKNPLEIKEKRQVALEIAKKTIPQEIDGNLKGTFKLTWEE